MLDMIDELRMRELIDLLLKYNKQYYEEDKPTVSDSEYDALYDELLALEARTGVTLENSPTKKVGGDTKKEFKEYTHRARLYSLDKCKSFEALYSWYEKAAKALNKNPACSVEYKYDGLTINLTYEDGKLVKAATRGSGIKGEEVTEQVKTIKSVPLTTDLKGIVEVQGEGIMRLSVLEEYNKNENVEPLKNARNAAAGGIRNLDPKVTASRKLDVFAYNIGYSTEEDFSTQLQAHDRLVKDFQTGYFKLCNTFDEIKSCIEEIEIQRPSLDFLIDGAVVKINDFSDRETLGYTEKFPKWAMAFKFKAEEVTTTVNDIIYQVSRTGKLNPLAVLEPVDIGGVTVSRATLSNVSEIARKGIKIGSKVFVRRSNDVIPEILGVAEITGKEKEPEIPAVCPVCGSPVIREGVFLKCTNKEGCERQTITKLAHFTSKGAMDIDGLSEKTLELLFEDLGVKKFSDLFDLKREDLIELESFKDKKADNLLASLQKSKTVSLPSFLYALGIGNIGLKSARQLCEKFDFDLDKIKSATEEELLTIKDFGSVMSKCVVEYFAKEENIEEIDRLIKAGITFEKPKTGGALQGLNIVVTGTLERYKRSEIENLIRDEGGVAQSAVSKTTDYLVAGADAGSKLKKATDLGIKIITEEEFEALLGK